VAEAQETVVVVPVVLEVVEVELEVFIRVAVHEGHPMVAIDETEQQCATCQPFHRERHRLLSVFYFEF
jgi:hypothetical protein